MHYFLNIRLAPTVPVGEHLLGLWWRRRFGAEWWLPLNPVEHRLAAGAQSAAGARGQHGGIDFHFLIESADFYGSDGGTLGVQAQRERHVTEDVLGSQVNAFARVCNQLYVGDVGVACDNGIRHRQKKRQKKVKY